MNNENEKIDQVYDDRGKNGIKTWIFGEFHWDNWHLLGYILNNYNPAFRPFVSFFMNAPKSTVTCMTCRRDVTELMSTAKFNVEEYINSNNLPIFLYLLHNRVNCKLNSKMFGSYIMQNIESVMHMFQETRYCDGQNDRKKLVLKHQLNNWYEFKFWSWLQSIAFNFPADIQFISYWNNNNNNNDNNDDENSNHENKENNVETAIITKSSTIQKTPYNTFKPTSSQGRELSRRLRTYILFFDLLKNVIHRDSDLFMKWTMAYIHNTPNPMTFSCRTKMLEWLNIMQNSCQSPPAPHQLFSQSHLQQRQQDGMKFKKTQNHRNNTNININMNNLNNHTSFAQLMQILHPTRSI